MKEGYFLPLNRQLQSLTRPTLNEFKNVPDYFSSGVSHSLPKGRVLAFLMVLDAVTDSNLTTFCPDNP